MGSTIISPLSLLHENAAEREVITVLSYKCSLSEASSFLHYFSLDIDSLLSMAINQIGKRGPFNHHTDGRAIGENWPIISHLIFFDYCQNNNLAIIASRS